MILNVYNIRDERQGSYGTPIYTQFDSEQMAANYRATIQATQAKIERIKEVYPEKAAEAIMEASALNDCVLYHVGLFDNESGEYTSVKPALVCRLSDFFREVNSHA